MTNEKRLELMEMLGGGKCSHCGNDDLRVLEIDHVFGNGKEMPLHKTDIMNLYLDNPYLARKELQVLCRNCHRIKSLENGDLGRRKDQPIPITVKIKDIPKNNLENIEWYKHG